MRGQLVGERGREGDIEVYTLGALEGQLHLRKVLAEFILRLQVIRC